MPLDGAAATRDLHDRLISFLSQRRLLLLVDNCEHVVDAAAVLIDDILGRCPHVTVITTSREALAIPDEVQVTVGPLDTPPEQSPPGEVLNYPAAQLFAERARAVRPGLIFDTANLTAIGDITRTLDGIPLALELAAARVSSLSPVEVSQRLENRFTLLTSGTRTAEERQQTLRATVDWSYQLLSEIEQRVFDRLSVFHGGWTLMSAEAAGRTLRLDMLTRALDVCADAGGETVSFWSGPVQPGTPPAEAWARLEEGVAELVLRAAVRGVEASFEPEPGHLTERLVDFDRLALAAPGLRLALDTGHLLVTGEANPADAVRAYAPHIGTVAVEDMDRGVHLHKPFGTGDVDVAAVLAALTDVGFERLVTVELSRESPRAHEAIPESIAFLRRAEQAP